jgi:2-keto-4-pentenoate hydratase/2-oxohepta-3-ene-1,7-dioic acid hydratase in catechol pathway
MTLHLVTYDRGGREAVGALVDGGLVPLDAFIETLPAAPWSGAMVRLIRGTLGKPGALAEAVAKGKPEAFDEATLLAPIPRPARNVFCVGRNYAAHAAEGYAARGVAPVKIEAPEFFTKAPQAVVGQDATVPVDTALTQAFDYEVELAVIIGKGGANIPAASAMDHVFGFTVGNDLTARDLQRRHGQWFKGKSLDRSCPLGPYIAVREGGQGHPDWAISLTVKGEQRQSSRTSMMVFDVPAILEQLSRGMALEPGDIILTGTPEGVGYARKPPLVLAAGDRIEASVEGLGTLRTRIA